MNPEQTTEFHSKWQIISCAHAVAANVNSKLLHIEVGTNWLKSTHTQSYLNGSLLGIA